MKRRMLVLLLTVLMIISMIPMEILAYSAGPDSPWYVYTGFNCLCYPGTFKDYAGGILYTFVPEYITAYPTVESGVPDPNRNQIKALVEQHADVSKYAAASAIVDNDGNVNFVTNFYCETMEEANRQFFYVVYNAPTIAEATEYFVSKAHSYPVDDEPYNIRLDDKDDKPVPMHIHNFTGQYYTSGSTHQRQCVYEDCYSYGVMDGTLVKVDEFEKCTFDQEVEDSKYIKTQGNCTTPAVYYKSCKCGSKSIINSPTFSGSSPMHTLSNSWSKDATHHWHACKAEGCPIEDYANCNIEGVNYAEHTWSFGVCTECKYVCQHNYVEGVCTICESESSDDDFAGGDGSEQDPFQIATKAQLENLASKVNDGNSFEGKYFVLLNDIGNDEDPVTTVIGNDIWGINNKFGGTFDGDGYKVTMKIGEDFDLAAALAQANISLTESQLNILKEAFTGTIFDKPDSVLTEMNNKDYEHPISNEDFSKILEIAKAAPEMKSYIGLFCFNTGVIKNVETAGSLIGGQNTAGICVTNAGTIINCHNSCYLKGVSNIGGICCDNVAYPQNGTIINCYNEGRIEGNYSGGICGQNHSAIRNCYSRGEVTGNTVGGICGLCTYGSIKNCYYNKDKFSGNLIGETGSSQVLDDNYALVTGQMTAASNNTYSGNGAELDGKPLIDLLNNKREDGCKVWLNIEGMHPVFELIHDHSFSEFWTKDETAHWHACTVDGCKIKNYSTCNIAEAAYATHEWSGGVCSVCGYECTHSFDNDECAYCGIEQVDAPTATDELVYNGNSQIGVEEGTGYTLTGTASAIDAGEYQATATLKNGYIWDDKSTDPKNITWKIEQLKITEIALKDDSVEYNGNVQKPDVKLLGGNAKYSVPEGVEISYGDGNYTDVGTYTISVDLSECKNFTGTPSKEYSIVKCEINTITGVPAQNDVILGDAIEADLSDVKVAFGTPVAVYYSDEGCTKKIENINGITETGTYYVRAEVAETDNYVRAETKAISFTVSPAHTHSFTYSASGAVITATCKNEDEQCGLTDNKVTLTLTKNATENYYVYDGNAKAVNFADGEADAWKAAVGSNAPTITYTAKEGSELTEGEAVKAGSYTATVTVDTNKTATLDFTITKATPTVTTAPTASAITYGKTLADSTLTGGAGSVEGTFAWTNNTIAPAVSDSEKTEYEVTFTPADKTNYNTTSCNVKITVNKADYAEVTKTASGNLKAKKDSQVEITLPDIPDGASYGNVESNHNALYTIDDTNKNNGKLTLKATKDFDETVDKNATTFTVAVNPDGNHNGYSITVTVTPVFKTVVTITAEAENFTYGETGKTGYKNVSAKVDSQEVESLASQLVATYYKETATAGSYETEGSTVVPTDAGNYKVVLSVADTNEDYCGTKELTFTIAKADQTAPKEGEGYTVNYVKETITPEANYEVSTGSGEGFNSGKLNGETPITFGTKYYVRKAEDLNHKASEEVEFTFTRPAAPTGFTVTEESVENKKDGYISGITEAMEYKQNDGEWTAGPAEITGLSNETIKVRIKATSSSFLSEEYSHTFTASSNKLTVIIGDSTLKVNYGDKVKKPESDPVKEGYTFGGWYKDEACTDAWNFGTDTVTDNITLYAKWIEVSVQKAKISGNVEYENEEVVPNATVELYLGADKVAATTTDEHGNYYFDNVENGTYNIVVTKDSKTKTELVIVNTTGEFIQSVILPIKGVSSIVQVEEKQIENAKSDISQTVVGGLDVIAGEQEPGDGEKITIKLTVEPQLDTGTPAQIAIKEEAGNGKKVEFLDMSLWKTTVSTNGTNNECIGSNNSLLLTIVIPFNFEGVDVSSVMILRKHGEGNAEKLTTTANNDGEYYEVNEKAGTITVHAKQFSEYAIAYEEESGGWHPIIPIIPIIPIGPIVPVDKYYTVSFDMQGIGDAIDPITVQKGSKLAVQDTPIAEGYEFGGWFKEAECINAWDYENDTVQADSTLYAKWTKVEEPTPIEPEKVSVLLVKGVKSGDKAVKLSWNKVEGATKYVVYGNSCGKDVKKLKTTTGKTYTVKKIAGKKLTAHKVYKFYVVAYTPDGKVKSKTIHFITANTKGKYANVKSIKAKKKSLQLAVGEFGQVGATYKMYSGKKHLGKEHGKALRYISNCPEVASVSSTGKVLARQAGTATIYIQDVGGKYCKTTVTVK